MSDEKRPARRSGGSGGQGARSRSGRPTGQGRRNERPKGSSSGRCPGSIDQPRRAARDVLRAVRERDAYANLVLPGLLRERRLDGRDAALATELAYGAARARGLLDAVIAECAGRPVEEIDGPLLDVLELGAYQLLRTRIAPHAAVATSVDLVRAEAGPGKAGFVNAVLRRVSEKTEDEWVARLAPDAVADPVGHLAFRYAHPKWIAQAFADSLGADAAELQDVLVADDARPGVHLVARRVRSRQRNWRWSRAVRGPVLAVRGAPRRWRSRSARRRARRVGRCSGRGQPAGRSRTDAGAVGGTRHRPVARPVCRARREGGPARGARRHRRWPARRGGAGRARADLVRKTTRDLPVDVHVADGREPGLDGGYDRILVDAPCTGLGALRRRPEAGGGGNRRTCPAW